MHRRPHAVVIAGLFALLLYACSGGDDGPTAPRNTGPTERAAPILSATTIAPFAAVTLSGLPAARTDLVADVSPAGASRADVNGPLMLPLLPLGEDRYELRVPFHPTALADGGPMDVRVRGDSLVTLPVGLTLLAMPAAPGAFTSFLDTFQALTDARIAEAGTTREALLTADWDTLSAPLLPIAIAQTLIADPAHDRGLRNLVSGSPSYQTLAGGTYSLELLDRIIAYSGISTLMQEEIDSIVGPPALRAADAMPAFISISSGAELDVAMERARRAKSLNADGSATKELLNAYGITLGAIGVFAGPAGAAAAAGLGAGLYAYQTLLEGTAQLFPTSFVGGSLTFDPSIEEFYEDQPGPGEYVNVRVSATSEGWVLDKTLIDGVLTVAGGADAYRALGKAASATTDYLQGLSTLVAGTVGSKGAAAGGLIRIDPQVWSNIDISGPGFTVARVQGDAIRITTVPQYDPAKEGTSLLTVETNPARFGGAPSVLERKPVTVLPIVVRILYNGSVPPSTGIEVEPNDQVPLTIEVENALDDILEWELSAGSWVNGPTRTGTGRWTGTVQTPSNPNDFPVTVIFRSTATGGARDEPGAPERATSARIVAAKVNVIPESIILSVGETQQFAAEVIGNEDQRVDWSATAPNGSPAAISSAGLFTAPSILGRYEVKATSVAQPSAVGFADVLVVGPCYWSLQIDGGDGGSWSGEYAAHGYPVIPGAPFSLTFALSDTDEDGPLGNVQALGLTSGLTGSFAGTFSFSPSPTGSTVWTATNDEELGLSANVVVFSNDGSFVRGRMTGTAIQFVQNSDPILATFTLTFRSATFGECGPE